MEAAKEKDIDEFSEEDLAAMPTKSKNALPNAAFAVVEPCWRTRKDARHLPHHTAAVKSPSENSSIDLPHLRNALARMNQIKSVCGGSDAAIRARAKTHLVRHAKAVLPSSKYATASLDELLKGLDWLIEMIKDTDFEFTDTGWKMTF